MLVLACGVALTAGACRFIDQMQQIQGFEQLLRRLLLLLHQPAVVVVHWWSPVHDCSSSQQVGLLRSTWHLPARKSWQVLLSGFFC